MSITTGPTKSTTRSDVVQPVMPDMAVKKQSVKDAATTGSNKNSTGHVTSHATDTAPTDKLKKENAPTTVPIFAFFIMCLVFAVIYVGAVMNVEFYKLPDIALKWMEENPIAFFILFMFAYIGGTVLVIPRTNYKYVVNNPNKMSTLKTVSTESSSSTKSTTNNTNQKGDASSTVKQPSTSTTTIERLVEERVQARIKQLEERFHKQMCTFMEDLEAKMAARIEKLEMEMIKVARIS